MSYLLLIRDRLGGANLLRTLKSDLANIEEVTLKESSEISEVLRDFELEQLYSSPTARGRAAYFVNQLQLKIVPNIYEELGERKVDRQESFADMSERVDMFFRDVLLKHFKDDNNVMVMADLHILRLLQGHIEHLSIEDKLSSVESAVTTRWLVKAYKFDKEGKVVLAVAYLPDF